MHAKLTGTLADDDDDNDVPLSSPTPGLCNTIAYMNGSLLNNCCFSIVSNVTLTVVLNDDDLVLALLASLSSGFVHCSAGSSPNTPSVISISIISID